MGTTLEVESHNSDARTCAPETPLGHFLVQINSELRDCWHHTYEYETTAEMYARAPLIHAGTLKTFIRDDSEGEMSPPLGFRLRSKTQVMQTKWLYLFEPIP
jgi:hypothetical protein